VDNKKKALIFDFGNVLIDLDYSRHFNNFKELFSFDWKVDFYPPIIQNALSRYERGLISDDTFIWSFQQLNPQIDPLRIVKAWMSLLGDLPYERLVMLQELSLSYRIVLLSNINNFHLKWIHRYLDLKYGIVDFEDRFFDNVYYSHHIKLSKPNPEIYQFVESDLGALPNELLFIDDKKDNIEAAKSRGWNVQWHDTKTEITEQISNYLSINSF
jgi:putative hydrolase of the HAD superfamily